MEKRGRLVPGAEGGGMDAPGYQRQYNIVISQSGVSLMAAVMLVND